MAALTIPTLIQNYQTRAWDTASTVFARKLEEALKTMNTQQTLAGYKNTEDFVNELSKHFKMTKICKNDDLMSCFEDKVYWGADQDEIDMQNVKNSGNFGQNDWDTETIGVQFANGTIGLIAYNPDCRQDPYSNQITGTSCLAMLYDTSGFKNPNTSSKDLRAINVKSLDGKNCNLRIDDLCLGSPFYPEPVSMEECQKELEKGDLGIQLCLVDNDYWLGAVKQCGGVDNLPTGWDDARKFEKVFYVNGKLDRTKLEKYGFDKNISEIFAGGEDTVNSGWKTAKLLSFNSDEVSSVSRIGGRYADDIPAVCIIK